MKKTIALISRGWLSKDPRALFLARSFKKNGYKVIGINLDTPSDSGLNSPIFNEFECHNIEFDRSVAKDTYSLSKILLAHIDYKLSVYADRNLGKQTSYFVNYIRRKLNVIPVESSYELKLS